ncbi:MAG: Class I and II aminotransferase [candidate division WS6 bacterium GW2011_GWF2_39_15]|uniref:Aminotransferase n=1 Tax=candidate division WS6 bacterium GW2011_GWF2_39_15 TaxID=1619100 RepID=A0A0G0N016_9BACT|nr:MAG: Class I and II aminotransferase [candidate division WS6 bacterium GW2011_GWF2_39_15]
MPTLVNRQARRMNSLGEYFFSRAHKKIDQLASTGRTIINLGIGSPDLAPSPLVIKELAQKASDSSMHAYPSYSGLLKFRTEIANWYQREFGVKIDPQNMVQPTSGSKEGIVFTTLALVNPGEEVLIPNPGFATYERAAIIAGAIPRMYSLDRENGYQPSFESLEKTDLSKVKLMWINYPHNPTGSTASIKQLEEIVKFAKKHSIILVSDNPYSHISFGRNHESSVLEIPGALDIAVELNSLSKTYNMAGWRLGWVVGNPKLMKAIAAIYSNIETGIFNPIQYAGVKALQLPQAFISERNEIYRKRSIIATEIAKIIGCETYETKASLYVWAKLPQKVVNAEEFCFNLLENTGVFITPGTAFGSNGDGYIRIALCQSEEVLLKAKHMIEEYLTS